MKLINFIYNLFFGCKCKRAFGWGTHAVCGKERRKTWGK